MDSAVAGLIGAAIGALASVGGLFIQQRVQARHERVRMAVDLAIQDQEKDIELAKHSGRRTLIAPLAAYVMYHLSVLDVLAKGNASKDQIEKLSAQFEVTLAAFKGKIPESSSE